LPRLLDPSAQKESAIRTRESHFFAASGIMHSMGSVKEDV